MSRIPPSMCCEQNSCLALVVLETEDAVVVLLEVLVYDNVRGISLQMKACQSCIY